MTLATAKYHEMLDGVREFMILNEVSADQSELTNQNTNTRCPVI